MDAKTECLEALRGFIERADPDELGEAQAAIIQFAMSHPDQGDRSEAMGALRASLAGEASGRRLEPAQQAYGTVLDAMIERTREAVGS